MEAISLEQAARSTPVLAPQELLLQPAALSIDQFGARQLRLPSDADARSALEAAQTAGPLTDCCFFTWGNEQQAPTLLRLDQLPVESEFHGFLDGRWA